MANPNVIFKRGVHANLPWNNAIDGSFYLTTDTNRLYVANGTQLVDLNKYIKIVTSESEMNKLTNVQLGDFVYIDQGNILAVYKTVDGANKWVQINPDTDTNTDTTITEAKFARDTTVSDKIKINLTIKQSATDKITNQTTALNDIVTSFEIDQNDFNALIDGAKVGLQTELVEDKIKIATTGIGADTTKPINLVNGDNVVISTENNNITIAAKDTTYSLEGAGENTVILKDSNNNNSSVIFAAGQAMDVQVSEGANPSVTYNHADVTSTQTGPSAENVEVADGTFTAITGVTVNAQGHVTNVAKETFKVTLPETYYMVNGVKVLNQGSIDFYTKTQIDEKFNTLNPMVYRGVVNESSSLPESGVKVGDTYSVQKAGIYDGYSCEVGDLLIATGTETNGVITSNLEWTYIPTGDNANADTTYDLQIKDAGTGASVILHNNVANQDDAITLQQGIGIVIEGLEGDIINIAHKAYNDVAPGTPTEKKLETDKDIVVVSGVTTENGHVTGINTSKLTLTLPEDKNTTYTYAGETIVTAAADGVANNFTHKTTVTGSDNYSANATLKVSTNSLTIAGDASNVTIDLMWGTF